MRALTALLCLVATCLACSVALGEVVLGNAHFKLSLSDGGLVRSLVDGGDGDEYAVAEPARAAFTVYQGKNRYPPSEVRREGDTLIVTFEGIETKATFSVRQTDRYVALTLERLSGPEVDRIDLLALRIKPLPKLGAWINVAYDDEFGVCLCGGGPNVNAGMQKPKADRQWVDMTAMAYRETGLEGAIAILIGCPEPERSFLDFMEVAEADFKMPSGAKGRKSEAIKYSYMWVSPTVETIDRLIEWAKRGGFRMMLFSYTSFSKSCGHYEWNDRFPNGMADLKVIADKIRAAGLAIGLHIHFNKAHKHDPYVTPVPDDRLHIVKQLTLAAALDETATVVRVNETPEGCTTDDGRRILKVGKELVEYTSYTAEAPFEFRGCKRGALKTEVAAHAAGDELGLLDVDTWPIFIRFDQNTDIQEETAGRIARICAETGPYDMLYFDGSEDVHAPFWYHCANAQWRVHRKVKPEPKVCEAAANTHFGWHMMTRSNAYDSVAPDEMKDFCRRHPCRTAPRRALDFTKINFGWLHGFSRPDGRRIDPDVLEFILSRGAAWDCPFSMTVGLGPLASHPRADDCFDVIKVWEDARIEGRLSEAQKEELKDLEQEHHLFVNEKGEYELAPIERLDGVAGGHARPAWLFTRESDPTATYALLCEDDDCKFTLDFPKERLALMRPFGKALEIKEENGRSIVPVGSRRYLRFEGLAPDDAGPILQRAKSSLGPFVRFWLKASDFARKEGEMALGSEIDLAPEGAMGDVIVPTGAADMEGKTPWFVDYEVELAAKRRWFVWARCWYHDTSSNSFFINVPGIHEEKARFGNSYVWEKWIWERGGPFRLDKGTATVRFSIRESRPKVSPLLNVICITNDPRFEPTDELAKAGLGQ